MKRKTKIQGLAELFLTEKALTTKQIMQAMDVSEDSVQMMVCNLRKGVRHRSPMNVQSVRTGKWPNQIYKLMTAGDCKVSEFKEVLVRTQKCASTMGKYTWIPCAGTLAQKIPITSCKEFLLMQQGTVIDSFMLEKKK